MTLSQEAPLSEDTRTFLSFDIVKTLPLLPTRLTAEPAWQGHIPFARWLIRITRPRSVVELGVYMGDSYCTFCETVAKFGLDTRCHGIDAWQGDAHTGHYGDDIYRELSAHHDPLYGGFSRLIRAYFEDIRDDFPDGSIDLLHIDGLHTYEAVREDFETWLPKTSDRAVVLFHDTAVLQGDFGVWRLWNELVERYPHYTFTHSNGLGVLSVGANPPPAIRWLTGLNKVDASEVSAFFENLGWRIQHQRALGRLEEEQRALNIRIQCQNEGLHRLTVALNETTHRMSEAMLTLSQRHEMALWESRVRSLQEYSQHLENELQQRDEILSQKDAYLRSVLSSRSWLITAPLRRLLKLRNEWKSLVVRTAGHVPGGVQTLDQIQRLRHRNRRRNPMDTADLAKTKEVFRQRMDGEFTAFMGSGEQLILPCSATPKVSVVLVLWNQASLTLACFRGLTREYDLPLEVIIVDNASSDRTGELLERVSGARVIHNAENLGFLKAVNLGIAEARGEHVLLLNNDAVTRPGSLAAAVETLESEDTIGAVGGRIVLLNGSLQEAGSIIWRDGSCLGYARGEDPEDGSVMFRRDVDYCSGAFLLFRREIFERLGGFDEAYAPAYYEETDFCLRLWEAGLRVVYDPRVVIDHFEFGSSEKSESALALQQKNRDIFLEKHRATLEKHHAPSDEAILVARARDGKSRILVIDDRVPLVSLGAGYPRARHILQEIVAAGRFVTFYPLQTPTEEWEDTQTSIPLEVEVAMGHGLGGLEDFLTDRRGYYDTILVSRPHNMKEVERIRKGHPDLFVGIRLIYDAEAVFAVRDAHRAKLFNDTIALKRAKANIAREIALAANADTIITVSESEAQHFRSQVKGAVHILGHGVTVRPSPQSFAARENLLFVGALDDEGSPNVDSLEWFVKEVTPRLENELGLVVGLLAIGRNGAPSLQSLKSSTVNLLGRVESIGEYYNKARVFIAPTRFAGGIPHKIHEAAAHGLPVVATSLLANQLGWTDGKELLVADDPEAFAEQVARLYRDGDLWESVRTAALARVGADCDPLRFRDRVRMILDT